MRKLYLFAGMALMAVMMAFVTSSCSNLPIPTANGKLTIKWSPNDIEVVEVVSLTKTQMVLKGFPDKGTSTFYIMTQDMQNLLNSL